MARIPQFQEQKITVRPQDQLAGAEGQNIANVGKLLIQTGDIFQQRKLARDMTKVNELATDFELELQDDYLDMQRERSSNPEEFAKDFNTHLQTKKKEFLEKAELGAGGRQAFQKIAESQRGNFGTKALQFENKQEVLNFADSVERVAEKNNLLAYRMGQDLDIKSLPEIDNKIQANVLAGSSFVPQEQLEKMRSVQTQNAYTDFIKGVAGSDINTAKRLIEDKKIQDKIGDVKSIDAIRSYIGQVEKRQKQLEKDALVKEKSLKKAQLDVEVQSQVESEFNKFNIGLRRGKDVVKNKKFNSMDDIITFRQQVKEAYSNNQITDAQYQKYISDTSPVMVNMIQKEDVGAKAFLMFTSVNELIAKNIKKQFKDNPAVTDSDLTGIYEDTYIQLQEAGIDLSSTNNNDKLKAQGLLEQNIQTFSSLAVGRSDVNSAIVGNSILSVNKEGKAKGKKLDNGGFETVKQNGILYEVRRDANGKVIEARLKK